MCNPTDNLSFKDLCTGVQKALKNNPISASLRLAAIVTMVAMSVLTGVLLGSFSFAIILPIPTAIFLPIYIRDFALEIKKELFEIYKKNLSLPTSNQNVVLVLEGTHDHNGAFSVDQRTEFNKLGKKCRVIFHKISHVKEITSSVEKTLEQNNRIKAIWIRCHGSPEKLTLGKGSDLSYDNVAELVPLRKIDPEARIILQSCSTGGLYFDSKLPNIAQLVCYTTNRPVIAPKVPIAIGLLRVPEDNPLNVTFWNEIPKTDNRVIKAYQGTLATRIYQLFQNIKERFSTLFSSKHSIIDVTNIFEVQSTRQFVEKILDI